MTRLEPISDQIVIRVDEAMAVTPGGIALPDVSKEKPQRGKVLAVGPGKLLDDGTRAAPEVAEGDVVLFTRYAGTPVEVDDEELCIMDSSKILAKVT